MIPYDISSEKLFSKLISAPYKNNTGKPVENTANFKGVLLFHTSQISKGTAKIPVSSRRKQSHWTRILLAPISNIRPKSTLIYHSADRVVIATQLVPLQLD